MPELNLESLFLLAQVDAPNQDEAIQTFGIGQSVETGEILVGADYQGVRYLLVPIAAEENFEEDVQSVAVQLVKKHHQSIVKNAPPYPHFLGIYGKLKSVIFYWMIYFNHFGY